MGDQLRETRPKLFKNDFQVSRVFRDHSKIISKIKQISKIIAFEMPVIIIAKEYDNPKVIKDKYKIEKELKESTFSNLFMVR
jgi:hypothetical protein